MSLILTIDGVDIPASEIKWDMLPPTATDDAARIEWLLHEYGRSLISAEDYAVIDEVIIDSVARGYVQRRRDGIDRA